MSSGAELERVGDPVELDLGGELDLRRAEATERAVRRRVRPGRPGADPDVRAAVRAARVDRAARLRTTGVSVQYAPPSITTSISWATSVPSAVTPGPMA